MERKGSEYLPFLDINVVFIRVAKLTEIIYLAILKTEL